MVCSAAMVRASGVKSEIETVDQAAKLDRCPKTDRSSGLALVRDNSPYPRHNLGKSLPNFDIQVQ